MDLAALAGLLAIAAGVWLWLDSLRARDTAVLAVKAACDSEQLQLLDDTVAIKRVAVSRDMDGVLRIRRVYGFEYSDTGNNRCSGTVVLLGDRVLVINLRLRNVPRLTVVH